VTSRKDAKAQRSALGEDSVVKIWTENEIAREIVDAAFHIPNFAVLFQRIARFGQNFPNALPQ
jgi:hypothetical protein